MKQSRAQGRKHVWMLGKKVGLDLSGWREGPALIILGLVCFPPVQTIG